MVQCFVCYQVVDPFQASSDFSAPVIPVTPCCLQQAFLQFICSQIICHSIFLSSLCWIIFVELSGLVAKTACILIQEVNWLWTSRTAASRCTELRASASSLQLWWLFLCLWCLSWLLGDLNKVVVHIIFTLHVVPQFSFLFNLLHMFHNCSIFDSFCMFQKIE